MNKMINVFLLFLIIAGGSAMGDKQWSNEGDMKNKSVEYWRERLTPEQFEVCRNKGTEKPFLNAYDKLYDEGTYVCAACCCDHPLYSSEAKFDSGTGWPSFYQPIDQKSIELQEDNKLFFIKRTEVLCSRCGSHLGHVFDDGPRPTGKRYCMNSVALKFIPAQKE